MDCDQCVKNLAVVVGGVLFGSAGLKLLSSRDTKKAYTHATAAALRMKESVMETVPTVQENAADILASAKDLNAAEIPPADRSSFVEAERAKGHHHDRGWYQLAWKSPIHGQYQWSAPSHDLPGVLRSPLNSPQPIRGYSQKILLPRKPLCIG